MCPTSAPSTTATSDKLRAPFARSASTSRASASVPKADAFSAWMAGSSPGISRRTSSFITYLLPRVPSARGRWLCPCGGRRMPDTAEPREPVSPAHDLARAEAGRAGGVAAGHGLVFAILDPPAGLGAAGIVDYVLNTTALGNLSEHAAIYWPRVKVLNPSRSVFGSRDQLVVAPSGIIAGVFSRTDGGRPGGVYDPPAGIDKGRMFGVLGFETDEVLEERKRDLVYPKRINPLTTGPGLPCYIDGSRTLKGDGNFPYVAERRGVSFIERSLKQGLQFARHKNNTVGLRAQVRRTITAFLLTQMNNGAFRSREPDKAFFVDVSDTLNTPTVIFAGKLIARVGLATNKPAEFIILRISQDTRALEAELAAAGA